MGDILTPSEVLDLIPQKPPFRFVDRILEVDEQHIVGSYTFRPQEFFYKGHFPGNPITPGVILLESMCQIGLAGLGLYLMTLKHHADELHGMTTLFTDVQGDFEKTVLPGETVFVRGERIYWRRRKLRCLLEMKDSDGALIARVVASGFMKRRRPAKSDARPEATILGFRFQLPEAPDFDFDFTLTPQQLRQFFDTVTNFFTDAR